jgi:hypothetical protein
MLMAPGRFSAPDEYPISYWILNERHLMRLMANYFQVNVPPAALDEVNRSPSSLRVAVQDSISNPEGVKVAKDILVKAGYGEVFRAEEPWANPLEKTKIIAQQGDLESAEEVRNTLGIGEIVLESTGSLESDVTVRLGRDWLDLKSIQVYKPKPLLDKS